MNPATDNPNLRLLEAAAAKLTPLLDQIAFVGGCAAGLLLTDPAAPPVRSTLDVDAIVAISSYPELVAMAERLRELGFTQMQGENVPVCRWLSGEVVLDLLPTDGSVLGFTNRWYAEALASAQPVPVGDRRIRLITAPYFLATKFEAFLSRGQKDYRLSHDLEDIITVIDGRPEVVEEVAQEGPALRQYLSAQFSELLADRDFHEALPGYLLPDEASQLRVGLIMQRMERLVLEGYERAFG
jgi:predicted nucleotidyltransferase